MEKSDLDRRLTDELTLGKVLESIARSRQYYVGKKLEKFDLKRGEYKLLIELYIQEGCCQDDIVCILGIDKFDASKGIKSLIEKGYVFKEKDKVDKRKHNLYLTQKAKDIKEEFIDILFGTVDIMAQGVSEEEHKMTIKVLAVMAGNMYRASALLKKENRF